MDEHLEITEDEGNDVVNMVDKIGNIGGFIEATNSDSFPNSEGIYTDMGQMLYDASRDILKTMNDIETRYLNRKREARENKVV